MDIAALHVARARTHGRGEWMDRAGKAGCSSGVGPCVEWGYLELAVIACDRTDIDDLLDRADRALADRAPVRTIPISRHRPWQMEGLHSSPAVE